MYHETCKEPNPSDCDSQNWLVDTAKGWESDTTISIECGNNLCLNKDKLGIH